MKKCKKCQTEIDDKATKCPHCQSDQRNWFKRHPILTGILILIFAAIGISAAGNGSSKTSNQSNQSTPSSSQASNQPAPKSSKSDLMKQNDPDAKHLATFGSEYVGKSFTLYAYIKTATYYNYGFDDESQWYSFSLRDDSSDLFESVYGYVDKSELGGKELAEKLLDKEGFYKLSVNIPQDKYTQGSNALIQINSWEEVN